MGYFIVYEAKGQKTRRVVQSEAYQWINLIKMNKYEKQELAFSINSRQTTTNDWISNQVGRKSKCSQKYTTLKSIITNGSEEIETIDKRTNIIKVNKS